MTMPRYSSLAAGPGGSQVMAQPPSSCWSSMRRSRWRVELGVGEERAPGAVRRRRDLQRSHAVRRVRGVGAVVPELGEPLADAIEIDVAGGLEEYERLEHAVSVLREPAGQLRGAPDARPVAPRVLDAELVQPADQTRSGVDTGLVGPLGDVLGARIALHCRATQRHGTVGRRGPVEPVRRPPDHLLVPGIRREQRVERDLHVQRQAVRTPLVRLQPLPEPAVGVLEPTQRVDHSPRISTLENRREEPPLEHPSIPPYKVPTCREDIHTPTLTHPHTQVLNESDRLHGSKR